MASSSSRRRCRPTNGCQNRRNSRANVARAAGYSVTGRRRSINQDCFFLDPSCRLFVVADGMGGGPAGERASRQAVETLAQHGLRTLNAASFVDIMDSITDAFCEANAKICAAGDEDPSCRGMGTTAVMAIVADSRLYIASVGDSRAYLVREGVAQQLTTDQTMAQILVDSGVYSATDRNIPGGNILWNCLGQPSFQPPHASVISVRPNDRLVLASDGLTDFVDADCLAEVVSRENDPREASEQLVINSLDCGTSDDSTCLTVHLAD